MIYSCIFVFQTCPGGQVPNSGKTACEDCGAGNYRATSDSSCQTCPKGKSGFTTTVT